MMATKNDFTEAEWKALVKGLVGAGMLVSVSDRDLSDTFGEASAMAKFIAGQHVAAGNDLVRELTNRPGNPFGFTASPDKVRNETMQAIGEAVAALTAKAPDDLQPYRDMVLGVSHAVAVAKGGGESAIETQMIEQIRKALETV
jgi:hypothetical protein